MELTHEQMMKFLHAIGAEVPREPPLLTDDPFVNYMVDVVMTEGNSGYDENLYSKEVSAFLKMERDK